MISNKPTNSDSFEIEYNTDDISSTIASELGGGTGDAENNGNVGNGASSSLSSENRRFPVAYSCKQLLANNQAGEVEVEYYYELLRSIDEDESDVRHRSERDTLNSVATHFGLDNGARCSVPPVNVIWLVKISSRPDDEPVNLFPCEYLQPAANQTCQVYHGFMTGSALGGNDSADLVKFLRDSLHTAPQDDSYRMAFLGTQIDTSALAETSYNNLPPAVNSVTSEATQPREKRVTVLGGFLVALFALACVGILLVLYRRRRKWLTAQDVELALSKSHLDGPSPSAPASSSQRNIKRHLVEVGSDAIDESAEHANSPDGVNQYTFDLGASMKNELFGIHGRNGTGKAQRSSNHPPGSDVSGDSDADSWAQTDGTIGSLEQQLDPITAEV